MNDLRLDFLGIGTIKSGTSLLADMLMQHPDIQWASQKEVNYFNRFQADGSLNPFHHQPLSFYRNFFPGTLKSGMKQGEYSPVYMTDPHGMKRIRSLYPEIRLIVTLRNPVDRAFSHFLYARDFLQIIPGNISFELAMDKYPYLKSIGMYSSQLKLVFSLFPRSQCLVLIFEEMIRDPAGTVRQVYRHLGVDDTFHPQIKRVNAHKKIRFQWLENAVNRMSQLKSKTNKNVLSHFFNSPFYPFLLKWKHKIRDANIEPGKKLALSVKTYNRIFSEYQEDIERTKKLLNRNESFWQ